MNYRDCIVLPSNLPLRRNGNRGRISGLDTEKKPSLPDDFGPGESDHCRIGRDSMRGWITDHPSEGPVLVAMGIVRTQTLRGSQRPP